MRMMEKIKIFYKSFQVILYNLTDSDNCEVIYCEDDVENRVYCEFCDNLCIEGFYKNHLKSQTHTNNKHKKPFQKNLLKKIWISIVKCVIDRLSKMNLNI